MTGRNSAVSSASPPKPPSKSRRNAPHPTTRKRPRETLRPFAPRTQTDLTDEEWARIEPFLPGAAKSGRPARTDLREVLNAIRYLARSGGGWRMFEADSLAERPGFEPG